MRYEDVNCINLLPQPRGKKKKDFLGNVKMHPKLRNRLFNIFCQNLRKNKRTIVQGNKFIFRSYFINNRF